jgi:light-regulated signal transduction histidine kinase (bacteriophytochrome)
LRAPLNLIRQFSQLVLDEGGASLREIDRRYLRQIVAHAITTDCLAESLLALSRATRLSLQKEPVDMRRLVEQVVAETGAVHRQPPIDIRIDDLPVIDADPALLKQVWGQLISNAVKFTRPRALAHIRMGALPGKSGPIFFIEDDGVGFDMAQADRLFRAFQRLHHPEDFPGTGVGLTIVEHIIRRHGGPIWAEAAVDQGATFYFTLE